MIDLKWIKWVAAVAFMVALWGAGFMQAKSNYEKQQLDDTVSLLQQKETQREQMQTGLDFSGAAWRKALQANSADAKRIRAGLNDAGIRLSVALADNTVCTVTGGNRPVTNGRAELSTDTSEFLIGQAKRADDQVKALQGVVKQLKGEPNGIRSN